MVERFLTARGGAKLRPTPEGERFHQAQLAAGEDGWSGWESDPVSQQFLAGTQNAPARSRQQIYQKRQEMQQEPVISAALRLHVTAALGGHETKGEMVFIESRPKKGKGAAERTFTAAEQRIVEELQRDLQPLINRVAPTVAFNAVAFGDAYSRIYAKPKIGIQDLYSDELVYPPLVQPYERGSVTVGYQVSTGSRFLEKLSIMQMARMKMPRMIYVPQDRVIEKSVRISLKTDDLDELPAVPGLVGGSFLDGAEKPYDNLTAALAALLGTRARGSIDEAIIALNLANTTKEQRTLISTAVASILERSHAVFSEVMRTGRTMVGKLFHVIPIFNEKQSVTVSPGLSSGQAGEYTIDDVLLHAKFLAGALGTDMAMLGFSDELSGGLGDGGFFRVSAHSAERSRMIRAALTEYIEHVIDVHVLMKYGQDYRGQEKPWKVTFYSGISALETERQKTKADAMNGGAVLVQTMQQLKELGLDEKTIASILKDEFLLDEEQANAYAKALFKAKADESAAGGDGQGGGFGGGFGAPGDPAAGGFEAPPRVPIQRQRQQLQPGDDAEPDGGGA